MTDAETLRTRKGLSVVVPVFNSSATLGRQLAALAEQEWSGPWEVIVADNGSTDDSAQLARTWADRLPDLLVIDAGGRRGASHARNVGAAHARYESIAWVDSDDRVLPGWLARMGEASQATDFFCSHSVPGPSVTDGQMLRAGHARSITVPGRLADRNFLSAAAGSDGIGVSRALFEKIGGFVETMTWGSEDTAFCWDAQLLGHDMLRVEGAQIQTGARPTTAGFFHQQVNWGIGAVDLYRRYADRGAPRSNTLAAIVKWSVLIASSPLALFAADYRWRWLGTLARRWGRLLGSIRFRQLFL